jgi:hypothetical protein
VTSELLFWEEIVLGGNRGEAKPLLHHYSFSALDLRGPCLFDQFDHGFRHRNVVKFFGHLGNTIPPKVSDKNTEGKPIKAAIARSNILAPEPIRKGPATKRVVLYYGLGAAIGPIVVLS